jgi:hypothetical protein
MSPGHRVTKNWTQDDVWPVVRCNLKLIGSDTLVSEASRRRIYKIHIFDRRKKVRPVSMHAEDMAGAIAQCLCCCFVSIFPCPSEKSNLRAAIILPLFTILALRLLRGMRGHSPRLRHQSMRVTLTSRCFIDEVSDVAFDSRDQPCVNAGCRDVRQ